MINNLYDMNNLYSLYCVSIVKRF